MNPYFIHQEILIITDTRFTWAEYNAVSVTCKNESKRERLKQACWDGKVPALLPECFENHHQGALNLWEINERKSFIRLEYGGFSTLMEKEYSINPYAFIEAQSLN